VLTSAVKHVIIKTMRGSKTRPGPTAEIRFFKMYKMAPKFTSKKFKKRLAFLSGVWYYIVTGSENPETKEEETMEIIEMLDNYGFITVEDMKITVADFVGFDANYSEIYDEEYEALDDEELDSLYSLLEDLEELGYTVFWTHEDI
jgi:hypothetical protein